uniref:Uncharacterized protein n=1 Tax=Anguilla anguilla TaxID=7936 RepID=A0A0E9V7L3_ANGAN
MAKYFNILKTRNKCAPILGLFSA